MYLASSRGLGFITKEAFQRHIDRGFGFVLSPYNPRQALTARSLPEGQSVLIYGPTRQNRRWYATLMRHQGRLHVL